MTDERIEQAAREIDDWYMQHDVGSISRARSLHILRRLVAEELEACELTLLRFRDEFSTKDVTYAVLDEAARRLRARGGEGK